MKGSLKQVVLAGCVVIVAGLACAKPRPVTPKKPVPPGTVQFQFTKKVEGPIDLTIDGMRVKVDKTGKKCRQLTVTGLTPGKHKVVLLSAADAFGPDQLEVEVSAAQGTFVVLFAQQFNSVLYGKPEPAPAAQGIAGVKALLAP
jgi:hypothetical protein